MKLSASIERLRDLAADPLYQQGGTVPRPALKHTNRRILAELQRALLEMTLTTPAAFYAVVGPGNSVKQTILALTVSGKDYDRFIDRDAVAEDYQLAMDEQWDADVPIDDAFINAAELAALNLLEAKDAPGARPQVAGQLQQTQEEVK